MTALRVRSLLALLLGALMTAASPARAADAEAGASDAITKAAADYATNAFDRALGRLDKALQACGDIACAPETRASLLLTRGVMLARKGDSVGSIAALTESLSLAPDQTLPRLYDAADVQAAFASARDAVQKAQPPQGDFTHEPWTKQRAGTPLPIYVEYEGHVSSVVVRYRAGAGTDWKRLALRRMGNGWATAIPCSEVGEGMLRYYVEGLDADDLPIAKSGSQDRPFQVTIAAELEGVAPHLPGREPPAACSDGGCAKDPARCGAEVEAPPAPPPKAAIEMARFWVGLAGSAGFAFRGSAADVCEIQNGAPSTSYRCTNPDGTDFPATTSEVSSLGAGRAGHADGGLSPSAIRVMLAFDFALTKNILLGARLGYVLETYSGHAAKNILPVPLHIEARGTWVFGASPLSKKGFAPLAMVALGATRIDAKTSVLVTRTGIAGQRVEDAWALGGPVFLGVGGGVRFGLSQRMAFTSALRFDLSLFGGATVPALDLETAIQYGL